jgi:D-glycero-D-manno-heptose 1,7-bisphosphate phosphatase
MMNSLNYSIKPDSALFIDRDGVINQLRVQDYVKQKNEFILLKETIPALEIFRTLFKRIFIVTNQQGIAKGLMVDSIDEIHSFFLSQIPENLHPDKIYHCPHLSSENCACRKPKPGMALIAKNDFPEINLSSSFMIGDSYSDMEFAKNAGMHGFFIEHNKINASDNNSLNFSNILEVAQFLNSLSHNNVK